MQRRKVRKNRKRETRSPSWVRILFVIFVAIAAVGLLANLVDFNIDFNFTNDKQETVTVYLVPGTEWSSDGSSYGAWCWNNSGVPEGSFVLGTDKDEDGVFEFNVSTEYSRMLFVDLVPEATELGDDWNNKRAQTDNLAVPTDKNVYYHQYANEWTVNDEILFTATTEEVTVRLQYSNSPAFDYYIYAFDKTGKQEACFILMEAVDDNIVSGVIPSGYTHLIFADCEGTFDAVEWQSSDLVIPSDGNTTYDVVTNSWTSSIEE